MYGHQVLSQFLYRKKTYVLKYIVAAKTNCSTCGSLIFLFHSIPSLAMTNNPTINPMIQCSRHNILL